MRARRIQPSEDPGLGKPMKRRVGGLKKYRFQVYIGLERRELVVWARNRVNAMRERDEAVQQLVAEQRNGDATMPSGG